MCACKKWKEPIGKNPLELNYGLIQGDFFVLMVIFCKNGTLSARDIDIPSKIIHYKGIIYIIRRALLCKENY